MALNALVGLSLAVLSGCTVEPAEPVAKPDAPAADAPAEGCPVLAPEADGPTMSRVVIGRQYVAGMGETATIERIDLGDVVLRSTCSFSALNERTHHDPGRPRDGDTGFLPPGTAIRAVRGWAPECRLAAERNGQVYVYLALDPNAERAQPARCAVD